MENVNETMKNTIFNMVTEIEESTIELETLPDLIQLYIENYDIDSRELSENQLFDFSHSSEKLYSLLFLIQLTIRKVKETQNDIVSRYMKSSRNTESTTETAK